MYRFPKAVFFFLILSIVSCLSLAQIDTGSDNVSANKDVIIRIQVYEDMLKDMEQNPAENEAMAKILYQLGELYFLTEEFSKAVDCYVKSLAIREYDFHNIQSFGISHPWIMVDIGNSLYRIAEYDYARNIYLHAFRLFTMRGDQRGSITCLNNLGLCNLHSGNPHDAFQTFSTAMDLSHEINDSACIFISGVYKGMAYNDLGEYRNAIDILEKTRSMNLNSADYQLQGYLMINLAGAYKNIGEYDSAFYVYNSILYDTLFNSSMDFYKNEALIYTADLYFEIHDFSKAEFYYLEAWNQFEYIQNILQQTNVAQKLYLLYKTKGEYKISLSFLEEYNRLRDRLEESNLKTSILDYNQKIEQINSKWKIKEAEINETNARKEKDSQKKLSIFLIAAALMLIIVMTSSKGFDNRITYLRDYLGSFELKQKIIWLILLLIYFTSFYYVFTPINASFGSSDIKEYYRIIPGFTAFILTVLVFYFSFNKTIFGHIQKSGIKNKFFIVFTVSIGFVFAFESLYFIDSTKLNLNSLLSLFLIVFTSFILPFYFGILLVEKYIMKQVEAMAKSLDKDITKIKESNRLSNEEITIESEKTNASISFQLRNLLMVEAQGNYCMFYLCENGNCENKIIHITMKAVEEHLSKHKLIIRCHKYFIANIHHVIKVSGNSRGYALHFENQEITAHVSRGYQKDVMNLQ